MRERIKQLEYQQQLRDQIKSLQAQLVKGVETLHPSGGSEHHKGFNL
jgi:hypothetical protein